MSIVKFHHCSHSVAHANIASASARAELWLACSLWPALKTKVTGRETAMSAAEGTATVCPVAVLACATYVPKFAGEDARVAASIEAWSFKAWLNTEVNVI